ncbi:MAG: ABC transporter ATP-binding protein [bacterium]|nr:ABC transporter ATP-binding protein [bacterium]
MIEVNNLTRYYGNLAAIRDVSFKVQPGEILGFLGPNAAGKTTTMRIITGFLPANSGTVRVAGFDIATQSLEARKRIGYLPENAPLYPDMTVAGYLLFHAKIKGVAKKDRADRVEDVLKSCYITDVRDKLIGKLSKGYRQRVGLAQAIIHNPPVLILDEPTIGLDPIAIRETRDLIKSLAGRHTVILSTHILPEVSMTCSRVVIINKGQVVAEDTPENLTAQLRGFQRFFIEIKQSANELVDILKKIRGVTNIVQESERQFVIESEMNTDIRDEVASIIVNRGLGLLELRPIRMTLEDVFVQLTTKEETEATKD